eukprot:8857244-Heterocapsa_arctica.AAC.1
MWPEVRQPTKGNLSEHRTPEVSWQNKQRTIASPENNPRTRRPCPQCSCTRGASAGCAATAPEAGTLRK